MEKHDKKYGLENLPQYEPKPELWDHIEAALAEDKKPRIAYMYWLSGMAATLALFLAVRFLTADKTTPLAEKPQEVKQVEVLADTTTKPMVEKTVEEKTEQPFVQIQPAKQELAADEIVPTTYPRDGKAMDFSMEPPAAIDMPIAATTATVNGITLSFTNTSCCGFTVIQLDFW
ncbi:MAG: hypothetical protein R3A43_01820 [Bacteroidia bacterium]